MNKKTTVPLLTLAIFMSLALMGAGFVGNAMAKEESVEKVVEQHDLEMKILDGHTWKTMDENSKIAFVWGVGHVIAIERELREKYPEKLNDESFSAKAAATLSGLSISYLVDRIDQYYKQNPDDLDMAAISVLWKEMVLPGIKTGVAGEPLDKQ